MTEIGKFGIALTANDITLNAAVTSKHRALLASYRMNGHRGENFARDLIVRDLRNFLDLGALDRATDLIIVLALYMRETSRCDRRLMLATRRHRDAIALQGWRGAPRASYVVGSRPEQEKTSTRGKLRLVAPDGLREILEDEERV